jgi:tRNA(Arg) A34 adenosine deaminase TadA
MITLSSSQLKWINVAVEEATKSQHQHQHGCVIIKNGAIVGRGYNNSRSRHKRNITNGCATCHAEAAAIMNAVSLRKWKIPNRKVVHAKGIKL